MNDRGHTWKRNENGSIDTFAYDWRDPDSGRQHNGPLCVVCGYGFCDSCESEPDEDCSAVSQS